MRRLAAALLLSLACCAPAAADDGRGQLVQAICVLPDFGPRTACECAIGSLIDRMGEMEFRAGVLGELPPGIDRARAAELAAQAPALVREANAQCGSNLPTE